MLTPIDYLPTGVIGVVAHGRVTYRDGLASLTPSIDAARSHGNKVKLLYVAGEDFTGYEKGTLLDDTVFGTRNFTAFERIAYVGAEGPYTRAIDALAGLMPVELRRFSGEDLRGATRWLAAG